MGIISKIRGTIVHNVFEFINGATLTSTSTTTNVIVASSGFTVTGSLTGAAAAFTGAVSVSSAGSFNLPRVSTGTAPSTIGLLAWSTASSKLVFAPSTSDWVIVSTA